MTESKFHFLGFRFPKVAIQIGEQFPQSEEKINNTINIKKEIDVNDKRRARITLEIGVVNEANTLNLVLEIKGDFKASDEIPDETFALFCDQNAPAILFPYARAFLSSVTAQAGIPPLLLPTLNFVAVPSVSQQVAAPVAPSTAPPQ